MTNLSPIPQTNVAMLKPQGAQVSRLRRAMFAFGVTFLGMAAVIFFGVKETPVNPDITIEVVKSLADIAIFIGIGYIGGSVVDYSGMFGALGARIGLKIPFTHDPGADNGQGGDSSEGN